MAKIRILLLLLLVNFGQSYGNHIQGQEKSRDGFDDHTARIAWMLCEFDLFCLLVACTAVLSLFFIGSIRVILLISCWFAFGIVLTAKSVIHSSLYWKYTGNQNEDGIFLSTILWTISTPSSSLEHNTQILILECVASIFLALTQISLSVLLLFEEDNVKIWNRAWIALYVPAVFLTLNTMILGQCSKTLQFYPGYEVFKESILCNLVFIYFTLPVLLIFERERKKVFYFSSSVKV